MNKFLTKLFDDKERLFQVICVFFIGISSIACNFISNSWIITIIYTICTSIFTIFELTDTNGVPKKIINILINVNKKILFGLLIAIALSPTIVGFCRGEIIFEGIADFGKKMSGNPTSNCLGVLIVYSLIRHLSKFSNTETIYKIISSKKHFCDVVFQFGFIAAFLNAINYNINEGFSWTNIFNGIHLFVIVFCGVIVTYVFALRLVSKEPFVYTVNKIFPTSTLICTWLFLVSCGFSPIVWGNAKHEVILLTLNTFAALIIIWVLFYLIKNKTMKNADEYPYGAPLIFSALIILNLFVNLFMGGTGDNTKMQFISGIFVLLSTLVLVFLVFINEGDGE